MLSDIYPMPPRLITGRSWKIVFFPLKHKTILNTYAGAIFEHLSLGFVTPFVYNFRIINRLRYFATFN